MCSDWENLCDPILTFALWKLLQSMNSSSWKSEASWSCQVTLLQLGLSPRIFKGKILKRSITQIVSLISEVAVLSIATCTLGFLKPFLLRNCSKNYESFAFLFSPDCLECMQCRYRHNNYTYICTHVLLAFHPSALILISMNTYMNHFWKISWGIFKGVETKKCRVCKN